MLSKFRFIGESLLVIEQYLPHRSPVLMLNRIVSESETVLEAEAVLDPDFPFQHAGGPVFDSVWCEMAAQTAAVFMGRSRRAGGMGFLTGIDDFEMMGAIRTPARVLARVTVSRQFGQIFTFEAEILRQDGSLVAKGGLSFFVKDPGSPSGE